MIADERPRRLGRYELLAPIGVGGMATVHLARVVGRGGFSRLVAVKLCDPLLSADDGFVRMFLDEARLAAGIHHPNVVATLDVCEEDTLFLVMEYVEGGRLADLLRGDDPLPVDVALRIACDALSGLHAAHELTGPDGRPLGLVHRDVSPHNVLVGTDGVTRIADFGVARAEARLAATAHGARKGKIAYMAPEQYRAGEATRRSDVFSAGIVLWEALTGRRLFEADAKADLVHQLLFSKIPPPSTHRPEVPAGVDAAIAGALARDPAARFPTALAFVEALEASGAPLARPRAVEDEVNRRLGDVLAARRALVRELEVTPPVTARPGRRRSGPLPAIAQDTEATGLAEERFEIRERIGAGGTAIVYRAFDRLLRREVALKRIGDAGAEDSLGGLALREGRSVAALDHPHVVRIHDVDPVARMLVMELVKGESLARRLEEGPSLGIHDGLRLAREIASGLHAAHRLGVLHLDLKPGNVLLTEDGSAKVADFGLAAAMAAATIEGPVGTAPYMAPEQRDGGTLDARTDVYGFGLVLFEMLAGRRFHLDGAPTPDPREAVERATRSPDLASICARCLEPDPDRRWPSIEPLLAALDEVARGISSRGLSPESRLPFEDDRHPRARDARRAALRIYALDDLGADSELTALVTEDPEHAAAAYYLAFGRGFALAPEAEALSAAEAALALPQPDARRAILQAIAAFARHDHPGSREAVEPAARARPEDWELQYALGEALLHDGDPEGGNRAFECAFALAPHMLLGHIHAVDFALARGDEAALARWLEGFAHGEARPEYGLAYRAFYRTWKGDPHGALEVLGRADGPNATQARIAALVLTGNVEEARRAAGEDSRSYWRGDPRTPDALALAWLSYLQGKKGEWERWMERARKSADEGRRDSAGWVYGQESIIYSMAGELDRAKKTLERARALTKPGARSTPFATALLAWLEGRPDAFEASPGPWPADRLTIAGLAEAAVGRPDAAIALLRRAIEEASDTWLLVPVAWCLAKLSRDRDRATYDFACDHVLHPRRVHAVWAYALDLCRD